MAERTDRLHSDADGEPHGRGWTRPSSEQIKAMQTQLKVTLLADQLASLDFRNLAAVLDWLVELTETFIANPALGDFCKERILQAFAHHGFDAGVDDPMNPEDQDEEALSLINRALMNMDLGRLSNSGNFPPSVAAWKETWHVDQQPR